MKRNIRIKRIYDAPAKSDGLRVLVDRLWPRGVRKEDADLDLWLKDVAPSPQLRKWFGHDPDRWEVFSKKYREELHAGTETEALRTLLDHAKKGPVTLLYAAKDTKHTHALVLKHVLDSL